MARITWPPTTCRTYRRSSKRSRYIRHSVCTDDDGDVSTIALREGIEGHPKAKERASARVASSSKEVARALEEKARGEIPLTDLAIS
eukprot:778048-Amphidinium_carterae.1